LLHNVIPASRRGGAAGTAEALSPLVTSALRTGDVVLVKGSAGSRTGLIVRDLLALDRNAGGVPQPSAH
jgi:UDP-N-acetylmuramoyl-tripeptide--D-alanyl-D-alanine ligase